MNPIVRHWNVILSYANLPIRVTAVRTERNCLTWWKRGLGRTQTLFLAPEIELSFPKTGSGQIQFHSIVHRLVGQRPNQISYWNTFPWDDLNGRTLRTRVCDSEQAVLLTSRSLYFNCRIFQTSLCSHSLFTLTCCSGSRLLPAPLRSRVCLPPPLPLGFTQSIHASLS